MKNKQVLPFKRWLWIIGTYCICSVIAITICAILVNTGTTTLNNASLYTIAAMLISGSITGLLSKSLPLQWFAVAIGLIILLNAACSLLVFGGISHTFVLQNCAIILGSAIGYFLIRMQAVQSRRKHKRRKI